MRNATTMLLVIVGWVFFRSETFGMAVAMLRKMFVPEGTYAGLPGLPWAWSLGTVLVIAGVVAHLLPNTFELKHDWGRLASAGLAALFVLSLFVIYAPGRRRSCISNSRAREWVGDTGMSSARHGYLVQSNLGDPRRRLRLRCRRPLRPPGLHRLPLRRSAETDRPPGLRLRARPAFPHGAGQRRHRLAGQPARLPVIPSPVDDDRSFRLSQCAEGARLPPSVVLLGSSFTIGTGNSDEQTLARRLESLSGCSVYNAGGWDSVVANTRDLVRRLGMEHGLVLLEILGRDAWTSRSRPEARNRESDTARPYGGTTTRRAGLT